MNEEIQIRKVESRTPCQKENYHNVASIFLFYLKLKTSDLLARQLICRTIGSQSH